MPSAWIGCACLAVAVGCADGAGADARSPGGGAAGEQTIEAIQGSGTLSPLAGRTVALTGVVTGDFQSGGKGADGDLGGFFVQSNAKGGTGSRGLFVYDGDRPATDVARGDRVSVHGRVQEFFGETQVEAGRVDVVGSGSVEPADITLPAKSVTRNADGQLIADLEGFEGMLVRVAQPLTIAGLRDLERYGEILLSAMPRPVQFTQIDEPSSAGFAAHQRGIAAGTLRLDDGYRRQNVMPVRYAERGVLRAGDLVRDLVGVLRYSRGSGEAGTEGWRLVPVAMPAFETRNPRPGAPAVGGELRVATFNLQNLFTGFGERCGPDGGSRCRGADNEAEASRQLAKIVAALSAIDADIVGLVELENDAADRSLEHVVDALNASEPRRDYRYLGTGPIGQDAIRVGLIYTPSSVAPLGDFATLTSEIDPRYDDRRNRPALAQTFRSIEGDVVTVIVAHLKSKGSDCDAVGDPDAGDGQGNCNRTRTRAAEALGDWALAEPTGVPGGVLIVGDLNAYAREDPVRTLEMQGFANIARRQFGERTYSYVFDGRTGTLDYALAGPGLAERIAATLIWHINADESGLHDYNLDYGREPGVFDAESPYRASDHDPIVVGIARDR